MLAADFVVGGDAEHFGGHVTPEMVSAWAKFGNFHKKI